MKTRFAALLALLLSPLTLHADALADLARPHDGRSQRSTSTMRVGEARRNRAPLPERLDPSAPPRGDTTENSNYDNHTIPAGETHVLMDVKGPGRITHIWMTFLGPEHHPWAKNGAANHQEMLLRIYWDGSDKPAVEAPVGDFFANAFGKRREVISVPVVVEDADAYNCYWSMPFRKSARVEIVNQSAKELRLLYYNIDWIQQEVTADTPYFHAQYRQEYPVKPGQDYVLLETQGKGHYVGTVLSVRTRSPAWFGEGDEKVWIDGEAAPSIWGTGTEDYFLSAWATKVCTTPYFGTPFCDPVGIVGGRVSSYRWHIADPLVFNTGIKVAIEHYGWMSLDENPEYKATSWNDREDDFSSVAFWYQTGTPTFTARAPHANERRLPSLDRVTVDATAFADAKHHGPGEARVHVPEISWESAATEGVRMLVYEPIQSAGAFVEIPIKVEKKEPLRLLVKATKSPGSGQYQFFLDGVKLGGVVDFHAAKTFNEEVHLLDFWPEPGEYKLRMECVGKAHLSSGYGVGVESVVLRERRPRVAQMGHDKDKDWRKDPKLYD